MTERRPLLYSYFESTAQLLLAEYQRTTHQTAPITLGNNRESFCSTFLSKVLPPKLTVTKGEIWDSENNKTGQLDIVIIRDDCPRLDVGTDNVYLAEGVFAVIEVKSNLTTTKLQEAHNSLNRVEGLTINGKPTMYTNPSLNRPLRIVFSYMGATWDTLSPLLTDTFDLICILNRGIMFKNGLLLSNRLEHQPNPNSPDALERLRAHQRILNPPAQPEPQPPFLTVNGHAASLGFLYLHLLHFASSFVGRTMNIARYFEPMVNWEDT